MIKTLTNIVIAILLVFTINQTQAQCPNTNAFYLDLTPAGVGSTASSACTWSGDYNTFTACIGAQYTITSCGSTDDTRITMYDAGGTLILTSDADNCSGSNESVTWTSTVNGVVRVLLDTWNCGHRTNCNNMSITMNTACSGGGGNPGDDCANAISMACGDSRTGETTIGNSNTYSGPYSCSALSAGGEDRFYSVAWTDATNGGTIRLSFDNVADDDAYFEVYMVGSTCNSTCALSSQWIVADDEFGGTGDTYTDYDVPAGATTYYFIIDSQGDGVDAFDIEVTCFSTGIELDVNNSCSPIPGAAAANQGYYQTWNGNIPDDEVSSAELAAMDGNTYTVCENIYIENAGFEWLMFFDLTVGDCWTNISNLSPNANNTGFYATEWCDNGNSNKGVSGRWLGTATGNVLNWAFEHPWISSTIGGNANQRCNNGGYPAWGDGITDNYTCNLYTFCYDAEVDGNCSTTEGFQNEVVATDDGVGGNGGGSIGAAIISVSATSPTLLPVELIDFNAEVLEKGNQKAVMVSWTTSSETNNDYFTVERSIDGKNYEHVGVMAGAGNSTETNHYIIMDYDVLEGDVYYRLSQTDLDGKLKRLTQSLVSLSVISNPIIYPNPSKDDFTVSFESKSPAGLAVIQIRDILGKFITEIEVELKLGQNAATFSGSQFESGVYFVSLAHNGKVESMKFLKE